MAGKSAINPQYARVLKSNWIGKMGEIKELDFENNVDEAREYINEVVRNNTNGKIENLLQTPGGQEFLKNLRF
jgi:serine protease inhibitor